MEVVRACVTVLNRSMPKLDEETQNNLLEVFGDEHSAFAVLMLTARAKIGEHKHVALANVIAAAG